MNLNVADIGFVLRGFFPFARLSAARARRRKPAAIHRTIITSPLASRWDSGRSPVNIAFPQRRRLGLPDATLLSFQSSFPGHRRANLDTSRNACENWDGWRRRPSASG